MTVLVDAPALRLLESIRKLGYFSFPALRST
jgi:hypothetical protein